MNPTDQVIMRYSRSVDAVLYQRQQTEGAEDLYIGAPSLQVRFKAQEGAFACLADSISTQQCPAP